MNSQSVLPIANIVAYVATLVMNFLSQNVGLELFTTTIRDLGESRAVFFLPAGYVFSIWGVIYLGLGAYIIYQGRPSQRENPVIDRIGWWFVLSSIGNITWLVLFLNNQIEISTVAIIVILVSLIAIFQRLEVGKAAVSNAERWAVHIPFTIYLGWISVATVANIAAALHDNNSILSFLGINADIWAIVMMGIATVLGLLMVFRRGAIAYALVLVWALVGIYARPFDTALFATLSDQNIGLVNTGALGFAVVIVAAIVIYLFLQRGRQPQQASLAGA